MADFHTYSVHRAGNLAAPEGSPATVRLEAADLTSHLALGKKLRLAGVLPKGAALRSVVLGRHNVTAFPRVRHISGAIELKRTDLWTAIGRGKAGWHAARPDGTSSSGGTLEAISGDGWSRAGYLADAAEGAHVWDAEGAPYDAFVRLVMAGPMLNVRLADDQIDWFTTADADAARRMMGSGGLSGGFEVMAARAIAETEQPAPRKPGSLDRVGWSVYRGLLEALGGVRFGTVRGGKVVWES